jgi:DNA-binding XRE family transcriptional regulator
MGTAGRQNGIKIRLMRVEREISVQDFAARAGIARRTLVNIELRRKAASVDTLVKIARVFGVPLDDLVLRDEGQAAA